MSGNAGNTSNANRNVRKVVKNSGAVAMALFEAFVLAEILWYYLHDGEQTLHEAFADYLHGLRVRVERRAAVDETRAHIRSLPETDAP